MKGSIPMGVHQDTPATPADTRPAHEGGAEPTERQVELMAHALGWPDPLNIRSRKGVMRREWLRCMREPYRNWFSAQRGTERSHVWQTLVRAGLATMREPHDSPYIYFHVTGAGRELTRAYLLRVRAEAKAAEATP